LRKRPSTQIEECNRVLLLPDNELDPKSAPPGTLPLGVLISPPLRLQHSPEKEETNTKLLPTCLPFGIMARRNFRSRRQTPELAKAAFRPERSTTKQSVVENMHQLEQLQSLQIQSRRPVSNATVDLKRQGTKTTTTLLPQPPWAKKPWETTTILLPHELI
jgi:hypothetical protein